MERREYLNARQKFSPVEGNIYENEGGGKFICIRQYDNFAVMENIKSGWRFTAHGIGVYPDGRIDWDYSTNGGFMK